MKKITFAFLFLFSVIQVFSQEEQSIKNVFQGTRLVNEQSANLTDKGKLLLFIQHRFGELDGGLYQLFGLDQATMRLGFEYGFGHNLNIGFGRSTYMKTYDLYGKLRIARQTGTFPLTLVATASGSVPTVRNYFPDSHASLQDKTAGTAQLHVSKSMGRLGFQVSPGFLSTGYLLHENQKISIFTLGLAGSVKISDKVTANIEYLPYFTQDLSTPGPLSLGFDIDTGGHLFQLIFSNSQQMFRQGLYTASMGDWTEGTLFFGFNLIREFRIKYY